MSLAATPQVQQQGMGAIPHENGVAFRVWAPNADAVYLIGDFNDWNPEAVPMQRDAGGNWSADVAKATIGDQYKYRICNGDRELVRIDPYARAVTNSIGNSIVHDPHFDWQEDDFVLPPWNELVNCRATRSRKFVPSISLMMAILIQASSPLDPIAY